MNESIRSWAGVGLVMLFGAMSSALVLAGDTLDGPALYLKYNCQICHGEMGRGGVRSGYPIVSGQDELYLIQQMKDIRDGVRDNGQAKLMRPLVKEITDDEIRLIATFLSETTMVLDTGNSMPIKAYNLGMQN